MKQLWPITRELILTGISALCILWFFSIFTRLTPPLVSPVYILSSPSLDVGPPKDSIMTVLLLH